ncbi:MAG: alpha/beta hydrolase [Myxococcota bacterium]
MLKGALLALGVLVVAAGLVLWLGALASLDWERKHREATRQLPAFHPVADPMLVRIAAGEQHFRARIAGFGGKRGNLVLLHGFPETSAMWIPLIEAAAAKGYQVVAFDQRGYSPGARPLGAGAYGLDELIGDVFDVADAVGFDRFHLVGHDWGAVVGWMLVIQRPERVRSWTSLSIPHLLAFLNAIRNDAEQRRRSRYVLLFRLPWLPEQLFSFNDFALLRSVLFTDHSPALVEEYLRVLGEPGAMTAAFNWYRAQPPPDAETLDPELDLPVLYVWGNQDPAVARAGVEDQRQYLKGAFMEVELDTGHWLMETETAAVVAAVVQHLDGS